MSGLMFASDIEENRQAVNAAFGTPAALPKPEPPGYLATIGQGLMRGGVAAARGAALAVTPFVPWGNADDPQAFLQTEHYLPRKEDFFRFIDEDLTQARTYWTPDPGTLNLSRKILGGLAELPLQLAGGGNLMALGSGLNTGVDLVQSGVDPTTATVAGGLSGVALKGMMALPQAGETLKQTLGLSAVNPLVGILQRYGTREGLEAAGYPEQAKSFDPLDPVALITDTVLGGVFGAAGYRATRYHQAAKAEITKLAEQWETIREQLPVEVVDSTHVMGDWLKALDANPFDRAARDSVGLHLDVLDKALAQVAAGKPVDIAREVKSLFGPDFKTPTVEAFRDGLRDIWNLSEEHTDATLSILNAVARYKGETLDEFIPKYFAGMEGREPVGQAVLHQDHPVSQQFDTDLVAYIGKTLPSNKILELGPASPVLQMFGAPDVPVYLAQGVLRKARDKHGIDLNALQGLVYEIQGPIAVFRSAKPDNKLIVITEIRHPDGNVMAAIDMVATRDGLQINDINSIHPKRDESIQQWLKDDLLLGYDKNKGRVFLENSAPPNSGQPQEITALSRAMVYDADTLVKSSGLYQDARGAVSFLNDGRVVLHALTNPDISTVMHELAHVFRRVLDPADLNTVAEFYVDPRGRWDRSAEEKFARHFERYLSEGKAPTPELAGIFEKFKTWLLDIYRGIAGSPIAHQIPNKTRALFDKMLSRELSPEEIAYRKAAAEVMAEVETRNPELGTQNSKGGDDAWVRRNPEAARSSEVSGTEPVGTGATPEGADTVGAGSKPAPTPPPDRPLGEWFPTFDDEPRPDVPPPTRTRKGQAETIEQAIVRLGGLDRDQAHSQWGATLSEGQRARMLKRDGLTIERMTESLAAEGFLPRDEHGKPVVGALEDALNRSLAGEEIFSSSVTDRQLDSRAAADFAAWSRTQQRVELSNAEWDAIQERVIAEEAAADQVAAAAWDLLDKWGDITLTDETGNQSSAKELLNQGARQIELARRQEQLYDAAAACLYL